MIDVDLPKSQAQSKCQTKNMINALEFGDLPQASPSCGQISRGNLETQSHIYREREGICKIKLMKVCETVVFDDFGLAALCVLVSHHRPEFVQYLWLNC